MKIINLTPHDIDFYKKGELDRTIPSSGFIRANQSETPIGHIEMIPIFKTAFGKVLGMPEPKFDTIYIVSQITAQALKEQGRTDDIYITHKAIRDDKGKIIGCEALAKI